MSKIVVGLMDRMNEAKETVDDLVKNGFSREKIDLESQSGDRGADLTDKLTRMGVPASQAGNYAEGVRRGGIVIHVETDDAEASRAAAIISRHGAVDIDRRAEAWRQTGERYEEEAELESPSAAGRREGMPLAEEEIQIGKREVGRGEVRAQTRVKETPVEEDVTLREQRAKVERRPVDRPLSAGEQEEAFRERSFEIPETAEEPVVSKQARVKEEIVFGQEEREHTEKIHETKRETEVDVERTGPGQGRGYGYDEGILGAEDEDFQRHFQSHYSQRGEDYQGLSAAYRYGATMSRHSDKEWREIEEDLRRDWDRDHPGTWNRVREAIHYGYDREHRRH